jgi:glc operon protein GlcG
MTDTIAQRSVSLSAARRVVDAACAAAEAMGKAMCVAVVDVGGEPVATVRMDGAPRLSASIAADKAWTVTSFGGMPTDRWWGAIKDEPELVHGITHTPRLIVFGGGVPLHVGGELVGAVGVSGGSADDDRQVAEAGAAVLA